MAQDDDLLTGIDALTKSVTDGNAAQTETINDVKTLLTDFQNQTQTSDPKLTQAIDALDKLNTQVQTQTQATLASDAAVKAALTPTTQPPPTQPPAAQPGT